MQEPKSTDIAGSPWLHRLVALMHQGQQYITVGAKILDCMQPAMVSPPPCGSGGL